MNASLVATNQAIESAAAEAAQAAAAASAAQAAAAAAMEAPTPSGPPVQVVTTTNFVADWARVVGGDRAEVFSLLQPGADPHTFLPGARDVARVADADLVLTVGLDLEAEWLEDLVHNASADESKIVALGEAVDPIAYVEADMHDDHEEEGHDDHGEMTIGRLLVADGTEAHLSVIDLSTDDIESGIFEVAAPRATVYPSPTNRYGIVLSRGPEDNDDRVHVFDGGVFLVEHGDHHDLVQEPVSRHSLEIADERPIHYVNSHGWTAVFADAHGHVFLINEADLASSSGDYEPVVLEAGPQHGAALVISDDHVVVTTKNPDYPENTDSSLPVGVEVRDFNDQVVYDASNRSCPGMHGESHNEHGAAFGCVGGVLFLEAHDGEYEHKFIANPPEMREDSRIGSVYGHHHVEHFFGRASYRGDEGFVDDGIWLIDVDHNEMRQVFSEPSASTKFSSDGELLYVLGADGVLHALDAHDGELIETMKLVEPGDAGRPAMVVVGEWLYVADPNSGHVLGVHLEHMEIEEEWEVGGAPSSLAFLGVQDSDGAPHEGHDEHEEEGHDDHGEIAIGRLLIADAVEAHLSVVDISTDGVESGIFEVAAPRATVYPSPTNRYGIVLSRGPEDNDDRVHVFDGGVFLVEHGDHHDLVQEPVSRHSLEIADERPIHYVNSHGWTAIFADAHGHVFLINEADLANSSGDYEPVVLEAGPQHGAALVISDDHVVVTTKNPDYPENTDSSLPVGVEVRDFSDQVVYDASNRSCPGMHGESHNEHGAAFGCVGGVLFLEAHDGEYEHKFIANPPEMREDSRIGSVYGHHHVEHFFGRASYRGDQGFVDDGIWLIDVDHNEMRQVFSEPSASTKFSSDGELLYVLGADGVLHALDAHDGELIETVKLVEPGDAGRPAMIVVGEWLYVADPNGGHVLGVHLEHMEIEEEWEARRRSVEPGVPRSPRLGRRAP